MWALAKIACLHETVDIALASTPAVTFRADTAINATPRLLPFMLQLTRHAPPHPVRDILVSIDQVVHFKDLEPPHTSTELGKTIALAQGNRSYTFGIPR